MCFWFCTFILFISSQLQVNSQSRLPAYSANSTNKIALKNEPIKPIPQALNLNQNKVELGAKLFHDPRLSSNHKISCATCHDLKNKGGTDLLAKSVGLKELGINSPTVYNSSLHFRQFWDGRVRTLEEQAEKAILSDKAMAGVWQDIVRKLEADRQYPTLFKRAYRDKIKPQHITNAIAEFERSLITPNSRFDRYLRGEENAISEREKKGYAKFKALGCTSCHQGMLVGGNMFQSFGIMKDYFADRGNITKADLGRYNVTKQEKDRHVFKVPSLRNILLTYPYFHDGSAQTLEEAVKIMGKYQLGRNLSTEDIESIVQFLKTLTGEYQGNPL